MATVSGRPRYPAPKNVRVSNGRYSGAFVEIDGRTLPADEATAVYPRGYFSTTRSRQGGRIQAPLGGFGGADRLQSVVSASLPILFEKVEVRSSYSPPSVFNVADLLAAGAPSPVVRAVKPTIILSGGTLGTQVLAPAGQASKTAWRWNLAALLASYGLVWAVSSYSSYRLGKRAGRRSR